MRSFSAKGGTKSQVSLTSNVPVFQCGQNEKHETQLEVDSRSHCNVRVVCSSAIPQYDLEFVQQRTQHSRSKSQRDPRPGSHHMRHALRLF